MLEILETPITVLHIIVCFFMILVILIQPGKSGGLGAALGGAGAQQVFGGRGAGTFLSKLTWICAITFFFTSMTLAYMSSSGDDTLKERAEREAQAASEAAAAEKAATETAAGAQAPAEPSAPPTGAPETP